MAQLAENLQANLSALGQVVFQTAANNLTLMMNQDVASGKIAGQQFDALTDVMGNDNEPFGVDVAKTVVVSQVGGDIAYDSIFVIATADAKYLANTMLGNDDGTDGDLDELQISAVGEIFSQFLNAAAPGMASMAGVSVMDFGAPSVAPFAEDAFRESAPAFLALPLVTLQCELKLADRSVLLQWWLCEEEAQQLSVAVSSSDAGLPDADEAPLDDGVDNGLMLSEDDIAAAFANVQPPASAAPASAPVTVQPVQFASFDNQPDVTGENNRNLDLLMDVKMSLSVRLGDTELALKQVLELTRGSVVELNRLAGEPVDLYANGKLIARGEVVVIEDNFGLRITSIVSPQERLRELANV